MKFPGKIIIAASILTTMVFTANAAEDMTLAPGERWEVTITTSAGFFKMELFNDTPVHRDNFVKLASEGFYDYQLFHRVIRNFMIQTGDPESKQASPVKRYGGNDAGYTIPPEINPKYFHCRGAVAAAREPDEINPEKNSSGSHFFIVTGEVPGDNMLTAVSESLTAAGMEPLSEERIEIYKKEGGAPHLDGQYTVFGRITSGMGVVEKISKRPTGSFDRPVEDIYIKRIVLTKVKEK